MPPSLGSYPEHRQKMAAKDDPVIDLVEEEEEEWPEAGGPESRRGRVVH